MTIPAALALTGVILLLVAGTFGIAATSRHLSGAERETHVAAAWITLGAATALLIGATWWEALQ